MRKNFYYYYVNILFIFLYIFISVSNGSNNLNNNNHQKNNTNMNRKLDNLTLCVKPHLVKISIQDQETLLNKAELKCYDKIKIQSIDPTKCPILFDSIVCWPETSVNSSVSIKCPYYVNKFNLKHKATRHCLYDPINARAVWSKSNYSLCLSYEERDYCNSTTCSMENHMKYMVVMRVCGYITSMISLILSIIILLRPKLRCPRNYVHINLFVAFMFRTLLVILSDSVTRANPYSQRRYTDLDFDEKNMVACRITVSLFRYSGSVYHMAIFSEAIYLVLLLKFPYYNELRGSKFCIFISWIAPIIWNVPWILTRVLKDNYWCWQSESIYNLILKIPQTLIYIANVCCAIYIIRILYSKMRNRNMSIEKIMKYRRLAKSILIIIPIFGLHFVFFAWIPYLSIFDFEMGPCFEMVLVYIETFFNAFQGLVVSIVCCFIHREVRIEFILYSCHLLKKIKFFQSLSCLNSDYIRQLRYKCNESRGASIAFMNADSPISPVDKNEKSRFIAHNQTKLSVNLTNIEEETNLINQQTKNHKPLKRHESTDTCFYGETHKTKVRSPSIFSSNKKPSKWCSWLFGDQKNDFFSDASRKSNGKIFGNKNRFLFKLKSINDDLKFNRSRIPSTISQTDESLFELNSNNQQSNLDSASKIVNLKSIIKINTENSLNQSEYSNNNNNNNNSDSISKLNHNISNSNLNDCTSSKICSNDCCKALSLNKSLSFSSDCDKNQLNQNLFLKLNNQNDMTSLSIEQSNSLSDSSTHNQSSDLIKSKLDSCSNDIDMNNNNDNIDINKS